MIREAVVNFARFCRITWNSFLPDFVAFWLRDVFIYQRNPELSYEVAVDNNKMDLKGRVVVYSITGCPHCMRAKNSLQQLSIPFTDINLDSFPQCREYVKNKTGKSTVPQIFFNNHLVGGNDNLQKMIDTNELEKLIKDVKANEAPADAPEIPDPSTAVNSDELGDFVCEPDEYALLVRDLKSSGLIKDHRKGLTVHKNSFSGRDFVGWVMRTKQLARDQAIEMGQALIDQHFGSQVRGKSSVTFQDADVYYRLIEDDETTALNAGPFSECEPRPAGIVGEEIRKLILKIYSAFLSPDGKKVNYRGIAGSSEFEKYKRLTKELVRVQVETASRQEKLAFFINIYNALVIHGNIVKGPPTNLWQRYKFFNTIRYIIGGQTYSLQDIENGVLRANRKGVGMFSRPFGKNDPRAKIALEQVEPLIHFALVCGAKSCPPIKTYSTDGVDEQLRLAAQAFLEGDDSISIDIGKREVKLSMIFKWYRVDFGKNNDEVVEFLHGLMEEGTKKTQLKELMDTNKFKIGHMTYDWGINS